MKVLNPVPPVQKELSSKVILSKSAWVIYYIPHIFDVLSQRRVLLELEELDLTLLSSTNNMRWLYLECSNPYLDKLIFL